MDGTSNYKKFSTSRLLLFQSYRSTEANQLISIKINKLFLIQSLSICKVQQSHFQRSCKKVENVQRPLPFLFSDKVQTTNASCDETSVTLHEATRPSSD